MMALLRICTAVLMLAANWVYAAAVTVTDMAGREVTIERTPTRIILGESRYLHVLSVLQPQDPLKNVVGILGDLSQLDYGSYELYKQKFPQIDELTRVGQNSAESFSVEKTIAIDADLAIFGVNGHGPSAKHAQYIEQLQAAGIPVIFIDFSQDPLVSAPKSITLLGEVLGAQAQAKAYNEFYAAELNKVLTRLPSDVAHKPQVFLHSRIGMTDVCCESMVREMMAGLVEGAGGENLAAKWIPGVAGVVNFEQLLLEQPDVYIATAVGSSVHLQQNDESTYAILGPNVSESAARSALTRAIELNHVQNLQAVKNGQAYAIWHHFYNSPLNIVALQVLAKWMYPQQFADVDPQQTLSELFERFQAIELTGVYWVALKPESVDE